MVVILKYSRTLHSKEAEMLTIRQGLFETNSSSVHVLVIPKDTDISIPSKVYLEGGEYGWQHEKVTDTINYMYQACLDAGEEEVSRFILYLMDKGIEVDYHGYDQKNLSMMDILTTDMKSRWSIYSRAKGYLIDFYLV